MGAGDLRDHHSILGGVNYLQSWPKVLGTLRIQTRKGKHSEEDFMLIPHPHLPQTMLKSTGSIMASRSQHCLGGGGGGGVDS